MSLVLLSCPVFFYDAPSMRLSYFAKSGRIWSSGGTWSTMPREARLQFLEAVFFTFSGVGFLLDLANPTPGRTAHILFLVFMGGAIGVAYSFCFLRAPKSLRERLFITATEAYLECKLEASPPWTKHKAQECWSTACCWRKSLLHTSQNSHCHIHAMQGVGFLAP